VVDVPRVVELMVAPIWASWRGGLTSGCLTAVVVGLTSDDGYSTVSG